MPVTGGNASAFAILPFSEFSGAVDPTHVDAIQMILGDGAPAVDAQIDFIGVAGRLQTHNFVLIPEPTSALGIVFRPIHTFDSTANRQETIRKKLPKLQSTQRAVPAFGT